MDENKAAIAKYISRNPIFLIQKVKKGEVYVKDGIVTYKVISNPLTCQCDCKTSLCNHIIFVLNSHFNLNFDTITFIHKCLPSFYENLNTKNLNNILEKIIYGEVLNEECCVCTEKFLDETKKETIDLLNRSKKEIAECSKCKKYCHRICLKKWLYTNKNLYPNKKCMQCNTGQMI
jgi:hypothetical protein